MYVKFWKRFLDFFVSLIALCMLSPLLLVLIITGAIAMRGNPFFTQKRPGKIDPQTGTERIFSLVKFRTMDNRKDANGNLLPDEVRLNKYGRILRSTSLDELPELWNILKGDMSIVGPRPLLVKDVEEMNLHQRTRHTVMPGLTGLAQCRGRNSLNWDEKLECDIQYIEKQSFMLDCQIVLETVIKVFKRADTTFVDGMDLDLKDWNEIKNQKVGENV